MDAIDRLRNAHREQMKLLGDGQPAITAELISAIDVVLGKVEFDPDVVDPMDPNRIGQGTINRDMLDDEGHVVATKTFHRPKRSPLFGPDLKSDCQHCKGIGRGAGIPVPCILCNGSGEKLKKGSREEILHIAKTNAVVAAELAQWHRGEISWEGAVNRALVMLAESCAAQEEQLAEIRWPSEDESRPWSMRGPGPW